MKRFVILLAMVMLSGCVSGLGPEFQTKAKEDLGMSPIIYYKAKWIRGLCGSSHPEPLSRFPHAYGALVVDDEKIAFVEYDRKIQKYDYLLQLKYPDVTHVWVFKRINLRRLVLMKADRCYTFEILKGDFIDKTKTYEFAIFIADKSGKDSSDFSKELAKEKELRSVQ